MTINISDNLNEIKHILFQNKTHRRGCLCKTSRQKHSELKIDVCIKEIDLTQTHITRVQNEVDILKHLDHPHIITYIDSYEKEGKYYIVMELIESGDLSTLIEEYKTKERNIPESLIIKLFSQRY